MPQLLSLRSRAHKPQLLSPRATTTEARTPRARALQREATTMRSPRTATKSSPHSLQLEKACAQQRRSNAAKKNKKTLGDLAQERAFTEEGFENKATALKESQH